MQLARDLWSVFHRKLYTSWGYETFDDYVIKEVGISKDRSYRLRRIFSVFVMKCGVSPNSLNDLGRSKAERLLPFVDRTNARDWVSKAKNLTYGELIVQLDEEKSKQGAVAKTTSSPASPEGVTESPDQQSSGSPAIPTVKLSKSESDKFLPRKFYLPPDVDSLLDEALGEAQRITKSASDGFNLSCIIQHFLAHRLTQEGKNDGRLGWFMKNMERIYGVRLIRVKDVEESWDVLREAVEKRPDLFGTSERPNFESGDQES